MPWQHWFYSLLHIIDVLFLAACAVISGIRFYRSPAGFFGPIGFGLLFLGVMLPSLLSLMQASESGRSMMSTVIVGSQLVALVGMFCVIVMLLTIKVSKKSEPNL
jgi:hypothetical protein